MRQRPRGYEAGKLARAVVAALRILYYFIIVESKSKKREYILNNHFIPRIKEAMG